MFRENLCTCVDQESIAVQHVVKIRQLVSANSENIFIRNELNRSVLQSMAQRKSSEPHMQILGNDFLDFLIRACMTLLCVYTTKLDQVEGSFRTAMHNAPMVSKTRPSILSLERRQQHHLCGDTCVVELQAVQRQRQIPTPCMYKQDATEQLPKPLQLPLQWRIWSTKLFRAILGDKTQSLRMHLPPLANPDLRLRGKIYIKKFLGFHFLNFFHFFITVSNSFLSTQILDDL